MDELRTKLRQKLNATSLHRKPALARERQLEKLEKLLSKTKDKTKKAQINAQINLLQTVNQHELDKGNLGDFSSVPDL